MANFQVQVVSRRSFCLTGALLVVALAACETVPSSGLRPGLPGSSEERKVLAPKPVVPVTAPSSSSTAKPSPSPVPFTLPSGLTSGSVLGSALAVTTLAGSTQGGAGGTGVAAQFNTPSGVAVDTAGNVYVADEFNAAIRKVSPAGEVTVLAGSNPGYADGKGSAAKFDGPSCVAVDAAGNIYVGENQGHRIRKVSPDGVVTTLAGKNVGYADGKGAEAKFIYPNGVAVDGAGNVYVADFGNHLIRKVSPGGEVTTLAGSTQGYAEGKGTAAKFNSPNGVAVDGAGNVYVADLANNRIRKVSPDGEVTTLAGSTGGLADGKGAAAKFNGPAGVAVDGAGNVYVGEFVGHRVRKVSPDGEVTTLAGVRKGNGDGTGATAQLNGPVGVAVDAAGNVYVADRDNHRIRKIQQP
jgi:sugar lactone lactonase YvrE